MVRRVIAVFLSLFTLSTAGTAYRFDTVFYTGAIQYDSSIRDSGMTAGVYWYLGVGLEHSLEGEIDYTYIKYLTQPDLNQFDLTLLYTNYSFMNRKIRFGYHRIFSDDKNTDMGSIFTLGYEYYIPYRYSAGFDINYSFYPDYSTGKKGLSVFQITPGISYSFGDYYSYGSFTAGLKAYLIQLSDNTGFGKSFYSTEGSLDYYYGSLTAGFSLWAGEQSFAVKNHGFIVYNLSEKYTGGYSLYLRYILSKNMSFTGKYSRTEFKEAGSPLKSKASIFVITVGTTF
ncbi:MAG TPA: hypothetical protein DEP48_05080 [Persephonella sp.]|uniref:Uncharacterized protein n=1 Tax=Persephonella marina (strain DSM 14350 / EX-H1) TaxID=123214 RepID=C0QPS7_PERMH|nr:MULTISPECIES: hypothetical protein [Persephonella]ACO04743.1 hypothetical protein PERMA_0886 [Persephonella marina EX-H1]HCB69712.1 hypothetical protein [Persephonella sp.]